MRLAVATSGRRGNNLSSSDTLSLRANAKIWPCQSYRCYIRWKVVLDFGCRVKCCVPAGRLAGESSSDPEPPSRLAFAAFSSSSISSSCCTVVQSITVVLVYLCTSSYRCAGVQVVVQACSCEGVRSALARRLFFVFCIHLLQLHPATISISSNGLYSYTASLHNFEVSCTVVQSAVCATFARQQCRGAHDTPPHHSTLRQSLLDTRVAEPSARSAAYPTSLFFFCTSTFSPIGLGLQF